METATVQGQKREHGGKSANARLRRAGLLPAIVYGHNEAPEALALSLHDTQIALSQMGHLIKVEVDGTQTEYLIKAVQYDHLQQTPIHLDLMRVSLTDRVEVRVPIELRGTPKGAEDNGQTLQVISDLEVECPVHAIPERFRLKIDALKIDDALYVRDIVLPEGVTTSADPDEVVVIIQPPRVEAEPVAGEAGTTSAEPEIIGKGKEETEDGEG